ncbi:MAG: DUF455 family protein [Planctomycetota bacterium]|nr:DUF455 family protein [Planctomycetota bacterium]
MTSALTAYVQSRNQGGVDIKTTVDLFRRYQFLERAAIPALAGWFLAVPRYEDKIALGYRLWAHAERADAFRRRLKELRGGHRDANTEPALQRVGDAMLHAPDEPCFLAGVRLILARLGAAYREHLAVADASANALERRILRAALADLDEAKAWYDRRTDAFSPDERERAARWTRWLEALLAAAGGVSGLDARAELPAERPATALFERPATLLFDARIQRGTFEPFDQRMNLTFEEKRVAEFRIFFNEFYAAAVLATILHDAWRADAPWEFFHDMAHHFWDEVRHAEFGATRLAELGVAPDRVDLVLFDGSQSLPFLHRLCFLTLGLEVFYMPRKQPRVKRYGEAGDFRTQLFADVDWNDEGNHVRYGKKWVTHFLEDDSREIEDLQDEIKEHMKAIFADLPEGKLSPF